MYDSTPCQIHLTVKRAYSKNLVELHRIEKKKNVKPTACKTLFSLKSRHNRRSATARLPKNILTGLLLQNAVLTRQLLRWEMHSKTWEQRWTLVLSHPVIKTSHNCVHSRGSTWQTLAGNPWHHQGLSLRNALSFFLWLSHIKSDLRQKCWVIADWKHE